MEARDLIEASWEELAVEACRLREAGHGRLVTFSPKVFIPLTKLCRDVCHYCTFAHPPRRGQRAYLTEDEVLAIARAGAAAGCHEALFTLGDKPELRYRVARDELRELGCETTLEYLARCARLVLEETGLLPHLNPGVMAEEDAAGAARGERLAGRDARDALGPALGARRSALRLARQAACAAAGDDRGRGPGTRAVHDRDPDRDRRDARGADRLAARDPRAGRALRSRAGGDRPELPRQARDADGRRAGAAARGAALDVRGRACPPRVGLEHPGAAEPELRRVPAAARGWHRRLGRGLARHRRPRQPGGAVARAGAAAPGNRGSGPRARAAAADLPALRGRARRLGRRVGRAVRPSPVRRGGARARGRLVAGGARVAAPARAAGPGPGSGRLCPRCQRARRGRDHDALLRAGPRPRGGDAHGRRPAARGERRHGQLRRHPQRQLHERLLLPLRLLRVLEGPPRRGPAREAVPRPARRDRPARGGGLGARRDRDLPPGRDSPGVHRRLLPRRVPRAEGGGARAARARVLRARGLAGRGHARSVARRLPRAPSRRGARVAAGHGRRDPRRRGARRDLSRQGLDRAVARGARRGPSQRPALDDHDHVRPRRLAALVGAAPRAPARAAAAQRRLHRVRAAPVRAHGGADLPQGPRAPGADVPRGDPDPRGRPARAASRGSRTSRHRG